MVEKHLPHGPIPGKPGQEKSDGIVIEVSLTMSNMRFWSSDFL